MKGNLKKIKIIKWWTNIFECDFLSIDFFKKWNAYDSDDTDDEVLNH